MEYLARGFDMAVRELLMVGSLAVLGLAPAGEAMSAGPPSQFGVNVPVVESSAGVWPDTDPPPAYAAYSPGIGPVTVWKGFQRRQAAALEFLQASPAP